MKRNSANQSTGNAEGGMALKYTCLASWRKLLERMAAAREMIFKESRQALKTPGRLLRRALNEAETVAWQRLFPHLVFPALAAEKVRAVAAWDIKRQALVRARAAMGTAHPAKDQSHHPSKGAK